jgi:hypothetical protein
MNESWLGSHIENVIPMDFKKVIDCTYSKQ